MNSILLLALGFVVGLSGALIPGPLLIYTISESLKKGARAGAEVITGHAIVEIFVIVLLMLGLKDIITSEILVSVVSILGGIVLIIMAISMYKKSNVEIKKKSAYGTIVGGIIFTTFNPSFPIWWATAGIRLLIEGFRVGGMYGAFLVVLGHWIADLGWYLVVSTSMAHGKNILTESWYATLKKALSLLLFAIGAYFLFTGIHQYL